MTMKRKQYIVAAVVLLMAGVFASAQTTQATTTPFDGQEQRVVSHTDGLEGQQISGERKNDISQWARTLAALAVVVGLMLLARWMLKKYAGKNHAGGAGRVMNVVGRLSISPRQQVMLVKLGKRLILLGCGRDEVCKLAEINDSSELAELLGQHDEEKQNPSKGQKVE